MYKLVHVIHAYAFCVDTLIHVYMADHGSCILRFMLLRLAAYGIYKIHDLYV